MTTARSIRRPAAVATLVAIAALLAAPAAAQMVTGRRIPGYAETFGVALDQKSYAYQAHLIESSAPGNILWPGEQPAFTIQLVNNTDQAIQAAGKVDLIAYGTRGRPGDIWVPDMFKVADLGSTKIDVSLPARGFANVTVRPRVPETFGAYALVTDLGPAGRQFVTSFVRTFPASNQRIQYPKFCLDVLPLDVLKRLGVQAVRHGVGYKVTTDKDFDAWFQREGAKLKEFQDASIAVLFMIGAGDWSHECQPLGRPRPWLNGRDEMLDTKTDIAWMPAWDADFEKFVGLFARAYGWPKGPINAFSLWNEPWEGISISGWGADMPRYREMYTHMAQAVEAARREDGADVLVGGCDSTSNALDKLFGDGSDQFLKGFDFVSIHYQGMDPGSTIKAWADRRSPRGRVKVWDTESWVANTDDRVAAVVAVNRSAGYDRAMGIYGGNIAEGREDERRLPDGKKQRVRTADAWSVAAAVGAATHFIGERDFREVLFTGGLPWVLVFDGRPGADGKPNPEDGTLVVVGDIGEEFGHDALLFRTARGLKEIAHKEELKRKLAALPADAPANQRDALEAAIAKDEVLSGAAMTLADGSGFLRAARFSLYDFYGNPVASKGGKITVPLDGRGFFLRGDGKRGTFADLVKAVKESRVEGIEPLATACHDMTAPIASKPTLRLTLTNVLNRPVAGTLTVRLGDLAIEPASQALAFAANETRQVELRVTGGTPTKDNTYPLALVFDAGKDGRAVHEEAMHVNLIARRTIAVDGKLDDWKDVLPQIISMKENVGPTLTEFAWQPFKAFDASVRKGFAAGYAAYDDQYFYFAAKIADDTPDEGTCRFETRNDDEYYYPEVSYRIDPEKTLKKRDAVWAASTDAPWALQKPGDALDRIAAVWEATAHTLAMDVELPKDKLHQVAFYFVDNDPDGRRNQRIEITDLDSKKVLDQRDITNCQRGRYAVYHLAGNLRIKLSTRNWLGTSLAGLFFGPAAGDAKTDGAAARFLKFDDDARGNWKGAYGAEGYHVIGAAEKYPVYVKIVLAETEERIAMKWPEGVRRYSYRKDPDLPSGNFPNHDNVQIGFNVLPLAEKPYYPCPPGTMPGYISNHDTDYEYALNAVAPKYGGGTEIWRLAVPGMPRKSFYPRQSKSPKDGPVKDGKLVMARDGTTRFVECAIPWTELPDVKNRLDAGMTVKFSFRVNDNSGGGCMELSRRRSVAKRNGSFHVDWMEHWANELEFAFEK